MRSFWSAGCRICCRSITAGRGHCSWALPWRSQPSRCWRGSGRRGLIGKPLGALTISVAAIGDLVSWILLAAVVASARPDNAWGAWLPLLPTANWALLCW